MSTNPHAKRPIVVKRRQKLHDEHGGQWKVAYADFVTAMMAFFLIMWLLATTTPTERATIAKYFTTASVFNMPAGNGVLNGGKSVMDGADGKSNRPQNPDAESDGPAKQAQAAVDRIERQRLEALKAEFEQIMSGGVLKSLSDHLLVEITREGLRVQIFDRDGEAMFPSGSAEPTRRLDAILRVVAQVLGTVDYPVVLTGHTDAEPLQRPDYSNWELSADRANAVRRTLLSDGLAADRILLVEGRAATDLLLPAAPDDPRNRRIAVTILRKEIAAQLHGETGPTLVAGGGK